MTTPSRKFSFWFALWDYLNQPVFDSDTRFIFNPAKFTVGYRTKLLKRCWVKDYTTEKNRLQLETCWHNTANRKEPVDNGSIDNSDSLNRLSDRAASDPG
ncbi:MAG: hypothetical protein AAFY17_15190 [Cyanobacteria bacterium J06642_11]